VGNWGNRPAYWSPNQGDYYLFRRTFWLPSAIDYLGSLLTAGGVMHNGDNSNPFQVYVNGSQNQAINTTDNGFTNNDQNIPIGSYLHSGKNVIAVLVGPDNGPNNDGANICSALFFDAVIREHAVTT